MKMKIKVGQKINRWTVLEYSHFERKNYASRKNAIYHYWKVKCECGAEDIRASSEIKKNKSCGCFRRELGKRNTAKVKIGKVFGFLEVLEIVGSRPDSSGNTRCVFNCKCVCGNVREIFSSSLREEMNPSCGCKGFDLTDSTVAINSIYADYVKRAALKNLDMEITRAEFKILIDKSCVYCGDLKSNLKKVHSGKTYEYNGLDRIDSDKGYTTENSVTCCKTCNIAKSTMTREEFLGWIKRVYNENF